jgi:hypothetical protein
VQISGASSLYATLGTTMNELEKGFERCKREFESIQSEMNLLLSKGPAATKSGRITQMRRALQLMKRWARAGEQLAAILSVDAEGSNKAR